MATQKDYEMIAKVVSDARGRRTQSRLECLLQLTKELADAFEADNPRFDPDLFTVACQHPQPDMSRVMTARRKARRAGKGWREVIGDVPSNPHVDQVAKQNPGTIPGTINPIFEMLRAGQIVGLDPREMLVEVAEQVTLTDEEWGDIFNG